MNAEDEPDEHRLYNPLQWDAIRVITVVVLACVAIAVGGLIFYLTTSAATDRRVKECLQVQVAELQAWANAAAPAGRADRAAQRELLLVQLNATSREEARAAVERYLQRLDETDRVRSATPPPARNCL